MLPARSVVAPSFAVGRRFAHRDGDSGNHLTVLWHKSHFRRNLFQSFFVMQIQAGKSQRNSRMAALGRRTPYFTGKPFFTEIFLRRVRQRSIIAPRDEQNAGQRPAEWTAKS